MATSPILMPGVTADHLDVGDFETFASILRQVARETGARVVRPPSSLVGRNYYLALLELPSGRRMRFMLNAAARLVGVARDDDPLRLDAPFLDVPRPDLFSLVGLRALPASLLEQPLSDDMLAGLDPWERREIAYHRPSRVGDVVFNWFD